MTDTLRPLVTAIVTDAMSNDPATSALLRPLVPFQDAYVIHDVFPDEPYSRALDVVHPDHVLSLFITAPEGSPDGLPRADFYMLAILSAETGDVRHVTRNGEHFTVTYE